MTVTIFGKEYTLRGDADPEYVQKVASFVHERMSEVAKTSSVASTDKVAILAAVNIADELFREKRSRLEAETTLEDKSVHIAKLLDAEVGLGRSHGIGGDSLPGT